MPAERSHRRSARRYRRARRLVAVLFVIIVMTIVVGSNRTGADARRGAAFSGSATVATDSTSLRLATFNMHSGKSATGDDAWPLTVRTITGFDFVGLQEVRGSLFGPSQVQRLGDSLGMAWCFAPSERRFWHDAFGNGALSTLPVTTWATAPMVNTRGKGYRAYLETSIAIADHTVTVLVAHLDRQVDREAQLRVVIDRFHAIGGPVILLGDLNTTAADPQLSRLLESTDVIDAHEGIETHLGDRRIDWIIARGFIATEAGVIDHGASDHPCFWAQLQLVDHP